jgi:hypothetical protein
MAKIGTAWPTQYDQATNVAASVGGYTGVDSDDLVRLGDYWSEGRPAGLGLLPCRDLLLGAVPSQGRVPRDQQPRGGG